MSRFLEALLGRLPIGWLQLRHSRTRLIAAIAGVAFANLLVLMQLGFAFGLTESVRLSYEQLNADIIVVASDMNTLADGSPLPRQRMYEALAVEGVAGATPLYFGKLDWKQPNGTIRSLDLFGIEPSARPFRNAGIAAVQDMLTLSDHVIMDRRTRNVSKEVFERIEAGTPYRFEVKNRTLTVFGTFTIGGGFTTDGYMIASDQTFLKLFPQRAAGAPNYILLTLAPGADRAAVLSSLRAALPAYDSSVYTIDEVIRRDQAFQTTQKPVGVVFGFGVIIGIMVGIIIVYQVLSTDVADHLREYATFKAIGYPNRFFLSIVFEEAVVLGILGFVPGLILSLGLYALIVKITGLPIAMTGARALSVFVGSVVMCALSGAIATRRLNRANPAELF